MEIKKSKTTQVIIDDIDVSKVFNNKFVKLIKQTWPEAKFQHFCIAVPKKKIEGEKKEEWERLYFGYRTQEYQKTKTLVVDVEKPETLRKALKILRDY
ncbi:hypothetical protein KAR91_88280 [Candidatus Pacearchaeota archaeon]|nr:hypothetical protein [Candidatus Pacearchaeota archaeon]